MSEYDDALDREGRDLPACAARGELAPVWGRDAEVGALLQVLLQRRSTLLVGPAGVGKTAVIHGLAARLAAERRFDLVELSTTTMMVGTRYLGEWQSKVTAIAQRAAEDNAVLVIPDLWNLPRTGRTVQSDNNLLDALRPYISSGRLTVVGEVTPELLRAMERVPGFTALFQQIPITPLGDAQVREALTRRAELAQLSLDGASRESLVQLTSRFLPARPQPGPALDLLGQVCERVGKAGGAALTPELVERVFCESTGLPDFVVSRRATRTSRELRQWFSERIVGQTEAIEAVVEAIALFKAGLHDPNRPLGTFLFVGPTGVGKTELARALATFLFGSAQRLLRFDLSEFKDYNSFEILVGTPRDPERPAALLDPIRAQPFQVVLLDELEKAHPNVWDLLLPLLDEGRLTPPGGQTVDARNTIVIATSNIGAVDSERSVGFGARPDAGSRRHDVQKSLEQHFRPELLNRFQHIVVFHPLSLEQVRQVARQELKRVLSREGITSRNLVVDVEDSALDLVIQRGFDPRYGARALKRELQRQLVLPLALTLMESEVTPGQLLRVSAPQGQLRVRLVDTDTSRTLQHEQSPVRLEAGRKLTREQAPAEVGRLCARIEALAEAVHEPFLRQGQARLTRMREAPDFWKDTAAAARALRDLDRASSVLDRVDRLRAWGEELVGKLGGPLPRAQLEQVAASIERLERALAAAWRELIVLGWDGAWDALVEVTPLGGPRGAEARDLVVKTHTEWATHQKMTVEWLRDPLDAEEPALYAVKGPYAAGLLRLEAGLHRLRVDDSASVARVRVGAWTDERGPVGFRAHRALKAQGTWLERVRSRVECEGGLVLQNDHTLNENRELAEELARSWAQAPAPSDEIVRRYNLDPHMVRDVLTGFSSGRPDALGPPAFGELLTLRVDTAHRLARERAAEPPDQNR